MANFYTKCKTNYFRITDVEKFKEICDNICAEYNDQCFTVSSDEPCKVCIAFDGPFTYERRTNGKLAEDSYEVFHDLKEILADGESIIFTEIGWEKLKCVTAGATIVTKDDVQFVHLNAVALEKARDMLKNPNYEAEF